MRDVEQEVRRLVRRCGKAIDRLWEKALDKDVAYEELREVVRVVDGLARLAVEAAEIERGER